MKTLQTLYPLNSSLVILNASGIFTYSRFGLTIPLAITKGLTIVGGLAGGLAGGPVAAAVALVGAEISEVSEIGEVGEVNKTGVLGINDRDCCSVDFKF
jgi:hypothetical protein